MDNVFESHANDVDLYIHDVLSRFTAWCESRRFPCMCEESNRAECRAGLTDGNLCETLHYDIESCKDFPPPSSLDEWRDRSSLIASVVSDVAATVQESEADKWKAFVDALPTFSHDDVARLVERRTSL